jgi:hypothetical protein
MKLQSTFLYETNIQCMKLITFLHVIGWGAAAGALVGSNHHVAGSRRGGGGGGGTGRSGEHGRRSMRSRGSTGRSESCCPCRWIWRGSVGTGWSRTHRRRSTRRSNAGSQSRHGLVAAPWCCLAAAFSPRHGMQTPCFQTGELVLAAGEDALARTAVEDGAAEDRCRGHVFCKPVYRESLQAVSRPGLRAFWHYTSPNQCKNPFYQSGQCNCRSASETASFSLVCHRRRLNASPAS